MDATAARVKQSNHPAKIMEKGPSSHTFKVLSCAWAHETNTFCVVETNLDSFRRQQYLTTHEEIYGHAMQSPSALGATYEAAEKYGWDLSVPMHATANPSGRLTDEVFELICNQIVSAWDSSYDGAILHLHGAMVSCTYEDAEGELLRRLRAKHSHKSGRKVPIVVTLDLHGNITELMAEHATSLIAVRTYPHIDYYERAVQGSDLLQRIMLGEIDAVTVFAPKLPMLKGLDGGRTQSGPMRELLDRADGIESTQDDVLVVSICAGFTAADIHDIGPSVTVTVNRKHDNGASSVEKGNNIAKEFMQYAFDHRSFSSVSHIDVPEAIRISREDSSQFPSGPPRILAEVTDNPGSGHYGDAVNLLAAMIGSDSEPGLENAAFYSIFDAEAVQQGVRIGVGNTGEIVLGGKHDPLAGGYPLRLQGLVVNITDGTCEAHGPMAAHVAPGGPSILFRVRGVDVMLISNPGQPLDVAQLTALGCDFKTKSTVCLKSNHHFRASFGPLSRAVNTVDGGGLGHVILQGGNYKNVRRPIWPLDVI